MDDHARYGKLIRLVHSRLAYVGRKDSYSVMTLIRSGQVRGWHTLMP